MNIITWIHETISLPALLACSGAILSAGGAMWASYEQNKAQKNSEVLSQEIKELNNKALDLSEENKRLAILGIDNLTGGDGFVYVDILKGIYPNAFAPVVISNSDFPQYDVSIRFYDLQKDNQSQILNPLVLSLASVPPRQSSFHQTPAFELPAESRTARYNLFISARNGSFIEQVHLRKVGDEWWSAIRLTKQKGDEEFILLEHAQEQYPKNLEGEIDWL